MSGASDKKESFSMLSAFSLGPIIPKFLKPSRAAVRLLTFRFLVVTTNQLATLVETGNKANCSTLQSENLPFVCKVKDKKGSLTY